LQPLIFQQISEDIWTHKPGYPGGQISSLSWAIFPVYWMISCLVLGEPFEDQVVCCVRYWNRKLYMRRRSTAGTQPAYS
jgi:hypothetical protein